MTRVVGFNDPIREKTVSTQFLKGHGNRKLLFKIIHSAEITSQIPLIKLFCLSYILR